ncbi:uncharacterized protein [Aegilops tauschii subsp. strangulata]|uniref:uncharacterized protein n=1 Tax=Aegilops tauschii subsp. strangulata TaxID=200361 RepID=UPI003CC84556
MERLKWSLGFRHGVAVNCNGNSGGLALWWKDSVEVTVRPWCQYYVDAQIVVDGVTGIYGEPCGEKRMKTWEVLRYLCTQDNLPWLCAGDFNEALLQKEQIGGNPRSLSQIANFAECMSDCGLADLGFSGYPFTWDNKRDDSDNIQVRLDRATCNAEFAQLFPTGEVVHVMTEESDHQALVVKVQVAPAALHPGGQSPFMYEEACTTHEGYEAMIASAWAEAQAANQANGALGAACNRFRLTSRAMQVWSRQVFGSIKKQITHLKVQLVDAKERAVRTGYGQEIKDIEDQLHELYEREEVYYKQRSRVDWLTDGDQNTKYFQNRASQRKWKNTIKALKREDGSRCTDDEGMRMMAA